MLQLGYGDRVSKVQAQIEAMTRHLYEQHKASTDPTLTNQVVEVVAPNGTATIARPARSVPLAPGVHPPMMGARFIPGSAQVRVEVHTREEAVEAINSVFEESVVDDVPSVEEPPQERKYQRKLEP